MNELPRQKLCELITQYGRSLCDDPRRTEALLRDFCGEHKREIFCLVSALKERVAADLLASQDGVPQEVLLARLAKRLGDNMGITEDAARWTVESWALALGMVSPKELSKSKKVVQPPIPTPTEEKVTLADALDALDRVFTIWSSRPSTINAALDAFREAGITQFSYDDIANRIETSKRLGRKGKYNSFCSKFTLKKYLAADTKPLPLGYQVQFGSRERDSWYNTAFTHDLETAKRWAREQVEFYHCAKEDVRIIRAYYNGEHGGR